MAKNIVLCYDGTNAEYREYNTNVVKTVEALDETAGQAVFYDPGVGTFSVFGRTIGKMIGKLLGMAFGYGIRENIEQGYAFLMDTYEQGDKVYIFGFSRGAYTARALAGMVCKFGILDTELGNLLPYVTKMHFDKMHFKNEDEKKRRKKVIAGFSELFCHRKCTPHFIGVWDTVSALGINLSKRFHNDVLNENIPYGYHAISVDERRWPYRVKCWDESSKPDTQTIEQVWFPGGHSDVGGGCGGGEKELSDVAFAWMMDRAEACDLVLKENWREGLTQNAEGTMHNGWKIWRWFIIATTRRIPSGKRIPWPVYVFNPGSLKEKIVIPEGKEAPKVKPLVHQSVLDRIESENLNYKPVLPDGYTVTKTGSYDG